MKIGIADINDAQSKWGNEKYKKFKEFGYDAIDYDMSNTDCDIYSYSEDDFEKKLLNDKALANETNTKINQVHGPWRWPPRDFTEADRAERMEKMKKSIRGAKILGCENWVIHPIMPFGVEDIGTGNEQKTWDMNIEFMTELLKYAKENNVIICLENMPMHEFSLATPKRISEFVKTMNDDNFKICLDTGHVSVFPDLSLGDEVRSLNEEIRVFHIHDNMFERDLHLMPYFGIIDWKDFSKSLRDINFDGVFSLEVKIPNELPTEVYEEMHISLVKTARHIIEN